MVGNWWTKGKLPHESKIDIAEFLSRHKFDITKRIVADIPVIDAIAGTCRMSVVEASPDGWMRDFINNILGATEHQFTVFRGNIYPEQPTWLTFTDHWWSKSLRKLGLARREAPVIAVSATEFVRCGAFAVERAFILRRPRSMAHGSGRPACDRNCAQP